MRKHALQAASVKGKVVAAVMVVNRQLLLVMMIPALLLKLLGAEVKAKVVVAAVE
jgi:hypothetical protein